MARRVEEREEGACELAYNHACRGTQLKHTWQYGRKRARSLRLLLLWLLWLLLLLVLLL
jgi:predicted nucleic acid-binding Zn ribbon protein